MQLLHLWSDPKKWEEFGLLRVCRVLSRLPSPRTRDKSIVAKFQQQNHLTDELVKLVCLLVLLSVMFFTKCVIMMAKLTVRFWRAPLKFWAVWVLFECDILQLRPPEWISPSTRGFPTVTATSANAIMGSVSTLGSPKWSASQLLFTCRWRSSFFLFCPNCISLFLQSVAYC